MAFAIPIKFDFFPGRARSALLPYQDFFILFYFFEEGFGRHFANHRYEFLAFFFSHRLIDRGRPERDSIGQTPKEKEACSMAEEKKVAYRAPAAQACNTPFS